MTKISIFGKGNMGQAIGSNFSDAGNQVSYITHDSKKIELGEIVVFAVPYPAVKEIIADYKQELAGKIIIDITNPLDFDTFDRLVVPSDSSAAALFATELPESKVVKGFNTTFAATLTSKKVSGEHQTTVLLASDDDAAKETISQSLSGSGLNVVDAGALKRAREKINWTGGFDLFK